MSICSGEDPGRLVFVLSVEEDATSLDPTLRVRAMVARFKDDSTGGLWYTDDAADYMDLSVRALSDSLAANGDRDFYGWKLEYQRPWSVDLDRAVIMVKVLGRIQRHLARLDTKAGVCANFGQYLTRVADACGIHTFVWKAPDMLPTGERHKIMGPDALDNWLRRVLRDFARKYPKSAAS